MTIDEFNEVGYVEGSDWTELDPEEDLKINGITKKKGIKKLLLMGEAQLTK